MPSVLQREGPGPRRRRVRGVLPAQVPWEPPATAAEPAEAAPHEGAHNIAYRDPDDADILADLPP